MAKPPTADEFAAAARLREALRAFQRHSDDASGAAGLTTRTYQLLLMVKTAGAGNGHATLRELEERLQLGKSTVTELVLRTERRGLVQRELDRQRGRGISIALTTVGARHLAAAVTDLGDERERLIDILRRLT